MNLSLKLLNNRYNTKTMEAKKEEKAKNPEETMAISDKLFKKQLLFKTKTNQNTRQHGTKWKVLWSLLMETPKF
jgi:hypothetical protein